MYSRRASLISFAARSESFLSSSNFLSCVLAVAVYSLICFSRFLISVSCSLKSALMRLMSFGEMLSSLPSASSSEDVAVDEASPSSAAFSVSLVSSLASAAASLPSSLFASSVALVASVSAALASSPSLVSSSAGGVFFLPKKPRVGVLEKISVL